MIPEIGYLALLMAWGLAVAQSVSGFATGLGTWQPGLSIARISARSQFLFLTLSIVCLGYAFVTNDFSVAYVAANSNSHLPLFYKVCAIWGAHEGSLLLWIFMLGAWTFAVSQFTRALPANTIACVLGVLGLISIGFIGFIVTTSDPFFKIAGLLPSEGRDLNPLLQDFGLAIHPPMLYMGYVGFAVAFAFAVTGLLTGKLDNQWARWSRPWTLVAWCFLTLGITLGSWWAYRELGWGGWWFWDPVENASLMPWLIGTGLIHALVIVARRDIFQAWAVLLAIFTFSLSLLGTFLVRSGILTSVHAFANDPSRGLYMLLFLFFVIGASLLLFAWRLARATDSFTNATPHLSLISRETLLLCNSVIMLVMMLTVLIGTIYPLILDILQLGKISVGPPYFNTVMVPMFALTMLLMGVGPHIAWQTQQPKVLYKRFVLAAGLSIILAIALPWTFTHKLPISVIIGLVLSLWIIITTCQHLFYMLRQQQKPRILPRRYIGMLTAHLGIAVCAIGISLTVAYSVQRDVRMSVNDQITINNYQFTFADLTSLNGPNYTGYDATFLVEKNHQLIAEMHPQKRIYTAQAMPMTESAISAGLLRDLYVALGAPIAKDTWSVRVYYKPFVRWIWLGGILMLLGGLLAATDRRAYKTENKPS